MAFTRDSFNYPFTVANSVWLDGTADYLSLNTVAGNRKTFTISFWFKRTSISTTDILISATDTTNESHIALPSDNTLQFLLYYSGSWLTELRTNRKFRDLSAWYHCLCSVDVSQSVNENKVKMYINGKRETDFFTEAYNAGDTDFNQAGKTLRIGRGNAGSEQFNSYITEFCMIDGWQLGPEYFGQFEKGVWVPLDPRTTGIPSWGNNGFYLDFSDENNLGNNVAPTGAQITSDSYTRLLIHSDDTDASTTFTDSSSIGNVLTPVGTAQHDTAQYRFDTSSILFNGTTDYITAPASEEFVFGTKDWTVDFWIRPADVGQDFGFIGQRFDVGNTWYLNWEFAVGILYFQYQIGSTILAYYYNSSAYNFAVDTWYHVEIMRDGSTIKFYINGVALGMTENVSVSGKDLSSINANLEIGRNDTSSRYFDGHMDEIRVRIGIAERSYGNHFTPISMSAANQVEDTPTNNWCTLNPLVGSKVNSTWSKGNCTLVTTSGTQDPSPGTFAIQSGKWYWEGKAGSSSDSSWDVGIFQTGEEQVGINGAGDESWYKQSGTTAGHGSGTWTYGSTWAQNDYVSVAFDADIGAMWIAKGTSGTDPSWMDSATNAEISSGDTTNAAATGIDVKNYWWLPFFGNLSGSGNANWDYINFGQNTEGLTGTYKEDDNNGTYGQFKFNPPAGFLSLCSQNLPDPAILQGDEHFDVNLNDGNNTADRVIGNFKFQPALVWGKSRGSIQNHTIVDRVRGVRNYISSSSTNAEADGSNVTGFNRNSLTVGQDESYNAAYDSVQWVWRADEHVAGMTKGAGTSKPYSGLVNRRAGFSIIGTENTATAGSEVPHHLDKAPELVIKKRRGLTGSWYVGSDYLTSWSYQIALDTNGTEVPDATQYGAPPSPTTFTVGTGSSAADYIYYCFHSVPGYSMVGSYVGNGNADGTFVYCGFGPKFILYKDSNSVNWWYIIDKARSPINGPNVKSLHPSSTSAEDTYYKVDFLANGFKLRDADTAHNTNGNKIIFYAIAETPFKYSNAR